MKFVKNVLQQRKLEGHLEATCNKVKVEFGDGIL